MRGTMEWVAILAILTLAWVCSRGGPEVWLVKGPGGLVYVFGTVHAQTRNEVWRTAKDWKRGLEIVDLDDDDERQ